ncbi:MAG: hypothetical protein CMO55_17905 [Verrucomicrobiales bacterium]|nr:hypothetical protein [Verrucomicrobiales bacterium]
MKSFQQLPDYRELRKLWKQEPVERPVPDLELTPDSWVERGAEVTGWWLARLEFWLSESGWLRAWLRLNLFFSITLMIVGVLLLPPVNRVLEELADSGKWLGSILTDLLGVISAVPPVIISLAVIYLLFIGYRRLQHLRRRKEQGGNEFGDGYYQ